MKATDDVFDDIEDYAEFNCLDCGLNTLFANEYYMVQHDLWDSVTASTKGKGMLCVGCLEVRVGRVLVWSDFTDAPINHIYWNSQSERLQERLMRV